MKKRVWSSYIRRNGVSYNTHSEGHVFAFQRWNGAWRRVMFLKKDLEACITASPAPISSPEEKWHSYKAKNPREAKKRAKKWAEEQLLHPLERLAKIRI